MRLKFMSGFQCLMGSGSGSGVSPVGFQDSLSNSRSSSLVRNDEKKDGIKTKKKKSDGRRVIKVFKPDGRIEVYDRPIKVSQVMMEEYMVCRSDSFYIGQKIPPLSQHDRLQLGHSYFILPTHLFHSVLSFVTIASFGASSSSSSSSSSQQHNSSTIKAISRIDNNIDNHNYSKVGVRADHDHIHMNNMKAAFLKKAAASSCPPFDIQKTPSGTLRIRVSEQFISQMMMDQAIHDNNNKASLEDGAADILCTTPQLHKEYKQLVVGSRRGWKPKLEMIKETPPKDKRRVKRLLSASINRMKRKINNTSNKNKNKKINRNVAVSQIISSSSSSSSSSASPSNMIESQPHRQKKNNTKDMNKKKNKKKAKKSSKAVAPPPKSTSSTDTTKATKSFQK